MATSESCTFNEKATLSMRNKKRCKCSGLRPIRTKWRHEIARNVKYAGLRHKDPNTARVKQVSATKIHESLLPPSLIRRGQDYCRAATSHAARDKKIQTVHQLLFSHGIQRQKCHPMRGLATQISKHGLAEEDVLLWMMRTLTSLLPNSKLFINKSTLHKITRVYVYADVIQ